MASQDIAAWLRTQLAQFIATQFGPEIAVGAIRESVLANPAFAQLDRPTLAATLEEILATRTSAAAPQAVRPRLLVDWGELPQIGRSARPLFSLIGPGTASRPTVRVTVDRGLDTDPADPLRQVRTEESGLWTFYVPFSLTTNGLDSRPGLYVIDVDVAFPQSDSGEPRFLRTQIRLNVPDGSSDRRELVIDGDGQSVINLAGHDLRSFSRVVLKGDDRGIINLQNFSPETAPLAAKPQEPVVFEYELKVNRDIQERMPRVVPVPWPAKAESLTLLVDDRRVHVLARKRVTFGRNRDNDVCLRFLPRSPRHDDGSRGISRVHMCLDLTDDAIVLVDEKSAKGVDVDCDPVKGERAFTHHDALGGRHVDVPSPLSADLVLEMDLTLFGRDPEDPDFQSDLAWDDVCFEVAGEPASRLWQMARTSGIEAARLRRLNNLPEEEHVFLYRHARIGKSAKDHAIVLPGLGFTTADLRLLYAGRMFWLHSDGRIPLTLDGERVSGACLVPLAVGHVIGLGSAVIRVARYAQLGLDDEDAGPSAPAAPSAVGSLSGAETDRGTPAAVPVNSPPPPPVAAMRATQAAPPLPQRRSTPQPDESLSPADPIRTALRSVAVISGADGHGSGFLAAPGVLVTNYHVVADSPIGELTASFPDNREASGRVFALKVLHEDPRNDLAFLGIDAAIPALATKRSFDHRNGHRIVAIGSPGVGPGGDRLENLTTDGRLGPVYADGSGGPALWALSMAVNPGNSGGPVVDAETGEVVAVVVAKFTATDGHALAVPLETLVAGLQVATASRGPHRDQAASLHRQRYCLAMMLRLAGQADAAIHALLEEFAGLSASGSAGAHDHVNAFTSGIGRDIADSIASLEETIAGELTLLRTDGQCSTEICARFERAWGGLKRLARQASSDVGRLELDIFAEDLRAALDRSRGLLDGLQAELL